MLKSVLILSVLLANGAWAQTPEFAPAGQWRISMNLGISFAFTTEDGRLLQQINNPTETLLLILSLQAMGVDLVAPVVNGLQIDRNVDVAYDADSNEVFLRGPDPANDHLTDQAFPIIAQRQRSSATHFLGGNVETVSERSLLPDVCGEDCLHTLETRVALRFTDNETLFASISKVVRFNLAANNPLALTAIQGMFLPLFSSFPTRLATLMMMPELSDSRVRFNLEGHQRVMAVRR